MNPTPFEISVAILLLAVTVVLVMWIRRYMAAGSERRMMRMLARVGLDPEIAATGDRETIITEVRRRCRKCQSEDLCERWLAGEETGENAFCPNAHVFDVLARTGQAAS